MNKGKEELIIIGVVAFVFLNMIRQQTMAQAQVAISTDPAVLQSQQNAAFAADAAGVANNLLSIWN